MKIYTVYYITYKGRVFDEDKFYAENWREAANSALAYKVETSLHPITDVVVYVDGCCCGSMKNERY